MPATKISLDQAKTNKLFYFVATVFVFRASDGRCLILKRDEREKVHGGKWGVLGGKLEWADLDPAKPTRLNGDVLDYEDAIPRLAAREVREEAGIEIEPYLNIFGSNAFVRPDGIPVVMIKCAARYKSGDVVLEPGAFTDFAWVNMEEVKPYATIDGIAGEVKQTIDGFGA